MTFTRLTLIATLLLVGCGDGGGDDSNGTSNAANNGANNGSSNDQNNFGATPNRPTLVEPDGCFAEPARPLLEGDEITYSQDTESVLTTHRMSYGSGCGSAMPVEIDWIAVFSSVGFDDDEYANAGAVSDALIPFFSAGQAYCYADETGDFYDDMVDRVVFLPTDTDDRIGLCYDETEAAIVYRFKLVEGDHTSEALTEQEITDWLTANIQ